MMEKELFLSSVESAKPQYEYLTKPRHYKSDNDVINFCLDNNVGFCEGNIIKYVRRWKEKNGIEDLLKAKEYIERLIQNENKNAEL